MNRIGDRMSLSEKELGHLEELSRIRLDKEFREKFRFQLNAVIRFVEELKKADISGYEGAGEAERSDSRLRSDEPGQSLDRRTVLSEAPESDGIFFIVPPVIDMESE